MDHLITSGTFELGHLRCPLNVGCIRASGQDDADLGRKRDIGVRDKGLDIVVDGRDHDGQVLALESKLEQVLEVHPMTSDWSNPLPIANTFPLLMAV